MYNSEKYVGFAVESLLKQTFTNFEGIFIDDCSTDDTLAIAKSFDDPRIKIIKNEKNLGMPGSVRNVGIELARGEYLYFLDNDDIMIERSLENLINMADRYKADVVSTITTLEASNSEFKYDDEIIDCCSIKAGILGEVSSDLKQRISDEILSHHMHCAVWLSLFKKDLIINNNIRFPDSVGEDLFWLFDIICATSKIIKIDKPVYIWRPRNESASHNARRLQQNINAVIMISNYVYKKLMALNIEDSDFIDNVTSHMAKSLLINYVLSFFKKEPTKTMNFIAEALTPTFGENTPFIKSILKNYILEYIEKQKLLQENDKLKNVITSIRDDIAQLINRR